MYDRDVANLFVPELLDLSSDFMQPAPKPATEEEAAGALAVLDPETATADPATVASANQDLGRLSVEQRTNKMLTSGTPSLDVLAGLREKYNLPGPDETIHGALVAVAEDDEDIDDITPETLAGDRRSTIKALAADKLNAYSPTSTTPGEFAIELADEVSQVFKPFSVDKFRLGTILQQAFPDDQDIQRDGHQNLSAAIRKAHANFLNSDMSVEVAREKMDLIEKAIKDAASNGYFSRAQAFDMLSSLLNPVASDDAEGFGTDVETFASAAEVVGNLAGVGGLLGKGVKAVGKLGKSAPRAAPVPKVGLLKGTYAAALAKTKAGFEGLVSIVRNRASNAPEAAVTNATKTEDIIASIALPKVDGVDVTKGPYIQSSLVDEATRNQLLQDPAYVFGASSVKRINSAHTVAEVGDGGITMTASFGTKNGNGYKSQHMAERANQREFGGLGTVHQDGNSFYIKVERSREFGLEDAAKAPDLTQPGTALGRWLTTQAGKMMYTTKFGSVSSATSTRQTEKVESALSELAQPYLSLPAGSQRNVAKALDYADANELALDISDLRGAFNLNDKEIIGYAAIRKLADVQLTLDNARLHAKYTADGWRSLGLNGRNYGVKVMPADFIAADANMPMSMVRAIDSATGIVTGITNLPPNKVVAKLMTPGRNGERYMVIDKADMKRITDLPRDIIPRKEGFLPRPYKYPAYVKRFKDGKVVETLRGARSQLEADELVAEMKASSPGEDFRAVVAQEFRDVDNLDEMAALEDAGMLFSSVRGESKLFDASGSTRMTTVEDRIRKMIADGAMSAGLSRWGDAQRMAWNAKFGDLLASGQWSPGQPASKLSFKGDVADAKKVQRAKHEAEFINNVMGVGTGAIARGVRAIGSDLAQRFYNTATRLDRLAGTKKQGNVVSNVLRDVGDNLIGASGRLLANAKTVPYMLFLAGNPIRQLPLQMTLIPSYFGVRGAGKYALGGFQRDFSIITANGMTEQGAKMAGKLGSDPELIEQFRRSGLMQSMEHHTMVSQIGTTGTTSRATRFGSAVEGTTKALTNVGIGAGIKIEKVSGWLIARNRWKVLNPGKKIDKVAEEEILAFAEELSLNPNRSDTLPINHGILGLFTQFLSMQVKQIGRTLQALPGVSTGQLTKREAAQMAAINLSVYGITGYGAKELAAHVMNDPAFDDVDPEVREIVADGISNYVLDTVLEAYTNEKADTAFSEGFSPNAQLGGSVRLVANLKDMILYGDWSSLAEARWQAPALGLTKQVADTISFMAAVYGAPPLPTPESDAVKQAAVIKKAMSVLPAFNNWQKMQAAINMRAKFNGRGDPTVEASYGEALAAILGVKTKEEVQLWELNNLVTSQNLESSDFLPNVRDAAYETSKWLLPLLDEMVDGKITHQEALAYIDLNNAVQMTTLSTEHHGAYVDSLREIVDKRWTPRYDALIQRILDSAGTDKLPVTQDAIETIAARIPDPEKREQVVNALKSKLFGAE